MQLLAHPMKTVAVVLALGLPALTGARSVLDAQARLEVTGHVESERAAQCTRGHDHRLCVLVYGARWSPASVTLELPAPDLQQVTRGRFDAACPATLLRPLVARSPPAHA